MAENCTQTEVDFDAYLDFEIDPQEEEEQLEAIYQLEKAIKMKINSRQYDEAYTDYLCEMRCLAEYGDGYNPLAKKRLFDCYIKNDLLF